MKKFFLLPLFIFLFSSFSFAQQAPKHEFYVGYGFATAPDLTKSFGNITTSLGSFGIVTVENPEYTGCFYVGFSSKVTPKVSIDVRAGYQRYNSNFYYFGTKVGSQQENYYTVLAGFKYDYGNIGLVTAYSGATVGAFINSEKETFGTETTEHSNTYLGYHVVGFGVRTNGTVAGYLEAGFGYLGMISGGLSLKF